MQWRSCTEQLWIRMFMNVSSVVSGAQSLVQKLFRIQGPCMVKLQSLKFVLMCEMVSQPECTDRRWQLMTGDSSWQCSWRYSGAMHNAGTWTLVSVSSIWPAVESTAYQITYYRCHMLRSSSSCDKTSSNVLVLDDLQLVHLAND